MTSFDTRSRDEFLKVLEEARRARGEEEEDPAPAGAGGRGRTHGSGEFLRTLESMAGRVRAYVSARLLAGVYADTAAPADPPEPEKPRPAPPPAPPPRSEHDTVVDELHLTPNLSADALKHLRRRFAKANHPDRVAADAREQATRRMTIANVLIDAALRGKKARER
jgi:hypothetical protein